MVCGEERLNAFRILGETLISAQVGDVTNEEFIIISLAGNIARQVEAVELMIASSTITMAHAEALLRAAHGRKASAT